MFNTNRMKSDELQLELWWRRVYLVVNWLIVTETDCLCCTMFGFVLYDVLWCLFLFVLVLMIWNGKQHYLADSTMCSTRIGWNWVKCDWNRDVVAIIRYSINRMEHTKRFLYVVWIFLLWCMMFCYVYFFLWVLLIQSNKNDFSRQRAVLKW